MDIWKKLTGELIDIVEWLDDSGDTLVYRFQRHQNEIKNGAKLTVRESQCAVFVNEGQIADVFKPGMYTLDTQNMPIMATLRGWKYGFNSPFKAEVYFVSTRQFTNLKWGTQNPIMMRDPEFGPIRLRAHGTFVIKVIDPAAVVREVAGTNARFTVEGITDQLRNLIVSKFADVVGESKIPALDLASNYDELGKFITDRVKPHFTPFGIDVTQLLVENISLPPEVEGALDKRTSMGIIGNLNAYTQFQTANAIGDAAKNPGGVAGVGAGLGAGMAMAQQMAGAMNAPAGASAGAMPPPLPSAAAFFMALNGQQAGPFDMNALAEHARAGRLTRETLVWKQGMAGWTGAGQVPELASVFGAVPPPLPPR
jgi:membrane protease subunit (stomatin/prohibitin family)